MNDITNSLPDILVACVGGGSNAIGTFYPFIDYSKVRLYGVEAGGMGMRSGQACCYIGRRFRRNFAWYENIYTSRQRWTNQKHA